MLGVVGELVDATEETPLLPQDLNTTIGIITATLDLLFTGLNSAASLNITAADVSFSICFISFRKIINFCYRLWWFLKF